MATRSKKDRKPFLVTKSMDRKAVEKELNRKLKGLAVLDYSPSAYQTYDNTDKFIPDTYGRTWSIEFIAGTRDNPLTFVDTDGDDVRLLLARTLEAFDEKLAEIMTDLTIDVENETQAKLEADDGTRYAVCQVAPFKVLTRMQPKGDAEAYAEVAGLLQGEVTIVREPYALPDERDLRQAITQRN